MGQGGGGGGGGGGSALPIVGGISQLGTSLVGLHKRRSTGTLKAFLNSLVFQNLGIENAFRNLSQQAGPVSEIFRNVARGDVAFERESAMASPVFGALEERVLSDLNDPGRSERLQDAFTGRLRTAQAARGTFSSGTSAFQESFQMLQLQEQLRQQAFQNAFRFSVTPSAFQRRIDSFPAIQSILGNPAGTFGLGFGADAFGFKMAQRARDINDFGGVFGGTANILLGLGGAGI